MQFVILGLLLSGPLSLYDVRKHFTSVISLFYSASFGSIQQSLAKLVEREYVTVAEVAGSARGRKVFAVTASGRDAWTAWMTEPITGSDPEKTVLARVFFLDRLPTPALRRQALAEMTVRIDADAAQLSELAAQLDGATVTATASYPRATLEYGIRSHRLALDWLAELREREGL